MFPHFLLLSISADAAVLTVVQTLNFDLVEVQRGGHADVEGTLGDGVSAVTHSDGHVPLKERHQLQLAPAKAATTDYFGFLTC